ncbi:MAG: phosphate regulon sensor histidine kinase PhoR [Gammaproteobacteria bacterium]
MNRDFARFAGFATAGLIIGLLFGHAAAGVAVALAACCYLLFRDNRRLYDWLRRHDDEEPPPLHGSHDDIAGEVRALRRSYRHREDKLTRYVERIQEATAALPDAIVILDGEDHIRWANQQATEYLGIHWPQDAAQRLGNLIRHPKLLDYLRRKGQSGDVKGVILPSPESPDRHIEYRLIQYGDGLRLLLARDVSYIERINRMRRDFIANASHELRTPLTVIAGYLESLDGDMDSKTADLQPQFRQMRKQAARMQTLIDDMLTLSRLESDDDKSRHARVAVPDLLAVIHQEAKTLSGERGHKIELDVDDSLLLRGDYNELYSAFSNLVANAVQYTPDGGTILIHWYEDEGGAHLAVSDTGEGIAPEHIPRLTERFYRVDSGRSRESGGTGLGLAIVKHVMNRHGGRLHIESRPGEGSIFRCDLPASGIERRTGADSPPPENGTRI